MVVLSWLPNPVEPEEVRLSHFSLYRIGRGSDVDIQIDDASISRIHAELVATQSGSYYLTDCESSNGSFVWRDSVWMPIKQDFIGPTEHIALGTYQTTATQLIAMTAQGNRYNTENLHSHEERKPLPADDLPKGSVRRDPGTGEIIGEES